MGQVSNCCSQSRRLPLRKYSQICLLLGAVGLLGWGWSFGVASHCLAHGGASTFGCGLHANPLSPPQESESENATTEDEDALAQWFPNVKEENWRSLQRSSIKQMNPRTLMRVLNRLPLLSESNWGRIQQLTSDARASDSIPGGVSVVSLEGFVERVEPFELPVQLVEAYQQRYIYVLHVREPSSAPLVSPSGSLNRVVVAKLPRNWSGKMPSHEPIRVRGLCVHGATEDIDSQSSEPGRVDSVGALDEEASRVLLAPGIQWYPKEENPQLKIGKGLVGLASNGFDVALLDALQMNSEQSFVAEEQTVMAEFYRAVLELEKQGAPLPIDNDWQLVSILQQPHDHVGECVRLQGSVLRVTPVIVESPRVANRLGLDRYYQLDLFVDLGNQELKFLAPKDATGERPPESLSVQGRFGITVLLSQLPDGMQQGEAFSGRAADIELPAFFLKQWRHRTIASQEVSDEIRKPNPIFIGVASQLEFKTPVATGGLDASVGAFFIFLFLMVAVLFGIRWQLGRSRPITYQATKRGASSSTGELPDQLRWPSEQNSVSDGMDSGSRKSDESR